MRTKLVYVLTCAPESYYIEQALMSAFSARHWNPDAHIVLIVDDLTDQLLVGQRAEVLNYVSEKILVPFEDESLSMIYRSRWIKTSVRQLIRGDFLFIDCDTIVCGDLSDIDKFDCEVGAVLEAHLLVKDYCQSLFEHDQQRAMKLGIDLGSEGVYFSSGVLFVRDTDVANRLFQMWNGFWMDSIELGMGGADQPALAKANTVLNGVIRRISDKYNCIVYTQNNFTRQAKILHISSYRNPSYLFTKEVLEHVRINGLNGKWLVQSILNPCATFLPFDYDVLHSTKEQRRIWIKEIASYLRVLCRMVDMPYEAFPMHSRFRWIVVGLMHYNCYELSAWLWMLWKRIHVLSHKDTIKDNVCRK